MKIAIESTHIGWGVCCIIGLAAENQFIQLDPLFLLMGITIKGSCFGGIYIRIIKINFINKNKKKKKFIYLTIGLRCKDDIPNLVEKYMNKEIMGIEEFVKNNNVLGKKFLVRVDFNVPIKVGNSLPLGRIPLGTDIHNVEFQVSVV